MADKEIPTDKVFLIFEKRAYIIEISSELPDQRSMPIETLFVTSPEEAALKLIKYHRSCVFHMNSGETMRSYGVGSDSGEWEHPWMTKWKFENKAQLTETQEGLLEGIINMRNQYIIALESSQRYMASAETVN